MPLVKIVIPCQHIILQNYLLDKQRIIRINMTFIALGQT